MILNWVRSIEKNGIEGQILAEIMHPATTASFNNQIVLDDLLHPIPGVRVREVYHGKPDAETADEVWITVLVLDKVAIITALFELILSDALDFARILDVWVDVNEGFDTVHGPASNHVVPVIVPVLLQLPVPDEACALRVSMLTNPVLHPNTDHGQLKIFHHRVLLVHKLLPANNANDGTLERPFR